MDWLTKQLKGEIKEVFESRNNREITGKEAAEIAENLTRYMEINIKHQNQICLCRIQINKALGS